jgi:ABC-type sugar transport system substrate-binding protein
MKRKLGAALLAGAMCFGLLAGCGTTDGGSGQKSGPVKVALSLANASDYYIGTMVGAAVQAAFEGAGANVTVIDAANDIATQVNQMRTIVTGGYDIMYTFPAGDGATYVDILAEARKAGVRTLFSNTSPGEGAADSYVGQDEFQMGAMMAAMVSAWIDDTYPEAGAGNISVLILESSFNESMIKRDLGMRLIGEEYLRKFDTAAISFVKGDAGLLLDASGNKQPNPYYDERVKLIEYSNRMSTGTDAVESQNAVENTVTMGTKDLKAVIAYGDVGAAVDTKVREMIQGGKISTPIDKIAVFCSDLTDTNKGLILKSAAGGSVLRGVMASGDLIATLSEYAAMMVRGENPPSYTMEPISYMMSNAGGTEIVAKYYTDLPSLPDTDDFLK